MTVEQISDIHSQLFAGTELDGYVAVATFNERQDNTVYVFQPDGSLIYEQPKLFFPVFELKFFRAGDRLSLFICTDKVIQVTFCKTEDGEILWEPLLYGPGIYFDGILQIFATQSRLIMRTGDGRLVTFAIPQDQPYGTAQPRELLNRKFEAQEICIINDEEFFLISETADQNRNHIFRLSWYKQISDWEAVRQMGQTITLPMLPDKVIYVPFCNDKHLFMLDSTAHCVLRAIIRANTLDDTQFDSEIEEFCQTSANNMCLLKTKLLLAGAELEVRSIDFKGDFGGLAFEKSLDGFVAESILPIHDDEVLVLGGAGARTIAIK